ncbi:MAG: hypothetical protein ACQETO_06295 [Pseudomonadota bacterium]
MIRLRRRSRVESTPPSGQTRSPAETGPELVESQVMTQILEDLRGLEQLAVLDLGFGGQETVSTFSAADRPCRLHFAGMLDVLTGIETPAEDGEDRPDEDFWFRLFEAELDRLRESHFDLLLFWDFFNYLDDTAVQGFNRALTPHIHAASRGHGFLAPNSSTSLPGRRFSLDGEGRLILRAAPTPGLPVFPRPQGRLNNLLDSMSRGHGVLRPGGLLEFSLKGA